MTMKGSVQRGSHHDAPDVEVLLMPADSPFAGLVAKVAAEFGGKMIRPDLVVSSENAVRLMIIDLTRVAMPARIPERCIVISDATDLDAWEVIAPVDLESRLSRTMGQLLVELLRRQVAGERETVQVLNALGHQLSAITDRTRLLDELLTHSRRVLRADGGSIYLVEEPQEATDTEGVERHRILRFAAGQNDTVPFFPSSPTVPVDESSLVGFVTVTAAPLNIDDARTLTDQVPYRPRETFDKTTGYETRSMLVVPMQDRDGRVIGVLLFVNHKPVADVSLSNFSSVTPFSARHVSLARSVASQAAVALENHRLYREIAVLFEGFVKAAVTAIESRDKTTAGHSERVAQLTSLLAREVTDSQEAPFVEVKFSSRALTELHYAALLHDFGKVGVREEVLLKAHRLYPWELAQIEQRFRIAAVNAHLDAIHANDAPGMLPGRLAQLDRDLSVVQRLNRMDRVGEPEAAAIQAVAKRWKLSETEPLLQQREVSRLCIPAGTLDPQERKEAEQHVEYTHQFLKAIPWTRELRNVATIAYSHHEKMNGTGYPRGLRGDDIPYGARIMTVADIFDALTASDRPYKGQMSPEKSIQILRAEASSGRVMTEVVELLAARRLWTQMVAAKD